MNRSLAELPPQLRALLRECLLAASRDSVLPSGRVLPPALAPLISALRQRPDDLCILLRWLFRHDHAVLEDPAEWAQELPDHVFPGEGMTSALLDAILGLEIADDNTLLDEADRLEAQYAGQQTLGHPTPYRTIREMVRATQLGAADSLCDLGSGHGRVVLYVALVSGAAASGLELVVDRCAEAESARRSLKLHKVRFHCGSVLDNRFWQDSGTVARANWLYLYDPFDDWTHTILLERLRTLACRQPVRLAAFIQTSRYRQRYCSYLVNGALEMIAPAGLPRLGINLLRVLP